MDQVGAGDLGDGVVAVGLRSGRSRPARGVVAVFRRTAGVDVSGDRPRLQPRQQPGQEVEVGPVDQFAVGLEGIGPVGDAVEDGPGPDACRAARRDWSRPAGRPSARCRRADPRAARPACGWPCRRRPGARAMIERIRLAPMKPLAPSTRIGPLKAADLLRELRLGCRNGVSGMSAILGASRNWTIDAGSRPHSPRWNFCEPYRPEG